MALRNIHSFGHVFDLNVKRSGNGRLDIMVSENGKLKKYAISDGGTQRIAL
jgi:hypothetical protein